MSTASRIRKRGRYVAQACDRCKAAKVRCDGGLPCSYCISRNPKGCHYYTARFPVHAAQETHSENNVNVPAPGDRVTISPRKRGLPFLESPSSPYFSIRILDGDSQPDEDTYSAKQLQTRQSLSIFRGKVVSGQTYLDGFHESTLEAPRISQSKISPLNELDFSQVSYLINEYRSMVDYLYPIVDIVTLTQLAEAIFAGGSEADSNKWSRTCTIIDNVEVALLKVLLTIVLPDQNKPKDDLASRLHQSVGDEVGHLVWNSEVDLNGIALLLLVSLNHLFKGRWRQALRMVDNVTRIILELGLNKCLVLKRSSLEPRDQKRTVNCVWTAHVLDQHLSHALGLSTTARNLHLDSTYPEPIEAPYLRAMIEYAQIGASICASLLKDRDEEKPTSVVEDESVRLFEYRLDRWKQRVEDRHFELEGQDEQTQKNNSFLRNIFLLRANHLRIIASRSLLSTGQPSVTAETVDIAADSINMLSPLYQSTKTYRFHQAQMDAFLISAVGIMLLALAQEQANTYSPCDNRRKTTMRSQMHDIAQHSLVAVLKMLQSKAPDSQHSRKMLDCMQDLLKRLDLLDGLMPIWLSISMHASGGGSEDPVTAARLSRGGTRQGTVEVDQTAALDNPGLSDGTWINDELLFPFGEYLNFDAMLNSDPFSWIL